MRRAAIVATVVCGLVATASPVSSWSNGTGGCNSFGTHDWILEKAIDVAGRKANWVRVGVALRATDDPDCKDGIDHASGTWWHVYDRWGSEWGGADEATRVWFRRTKRHVEAGRRGAASRALGIMSHFVADVANPMHTDSSDREDQVHGRYEAAVDRRIPGLPFHYDGRDGARPSPRTRRVARGAHEFYRELVRAFDRNGYNRKVHRITKRQVRRAANALADLITSLR